MDKIEVTAVRKYYCKKDMSPKEIHYNFIQTLWGESPFSTVKKWAGVFRRGRESVEDYERSGHHKRATPDENVERAQSDHM